MVIGVEEDKQGKHGVKQSLNLSQPCCVHMHYDCCREGLPTTSQMDPVCMVNHAVIPRSSGMRAPQLSISGFLPLSSLKAHILLGAGVEKF